MADPNSQLRPTLPMLMVGTNWGIRAFLHWAFAEPYNSQLGLALARPMAGPTLI
jgi:hypothetical protein